MRTVLALFSLLLVASGCSSDPVVEFSNIKTGMEKDEVLERIGSPSHTEREAGNDLWFYHLSESSGWIDKEVVFQSGKVTYVGAPLNSDVILKGTKIDPKP